MDLALPPKVTPRAFERLAEINSDADAPKALRVAVEGGGCSGFQYDIRLDDPAEDDLVLEGDGHTVEAAAIFPCGGLLIIGEFNGQNSSRLEAGTHSRQWSGNVMAYRASLHSCSNQVDVPHRILDTTLVVNLALPLPHSIRL